MHYLLGMEIEYIYIYTRAHGGTMYIFKLNLDYFLVKFDNIYILFIIYQLKFLKIYTQSQKMTIQEKNHSFKSVGIDIYLLLFRFILSFY
jgi:hypothetical protein